MVEPVALAALAALAIDAALGWPTRLYQAVGHPVGLFARVIDSAEARWNRQQSSFTRRRASGIVLVLGLILLIAAVAGALQHALLTAGTWGWLGVALLAWPGLAQRSLYDHVRPVAEALRSHDLAAARRAVSMIVGRDTATLDEAGVARAAIESLAESFCDGVAAPLFWLLVLGLPGLWVYKALNTADSLIGHREERWRAFGWAAARVDDLANLIPARLSGVLVCLAGAGGWRTLARDAHKHASPNAGWPEAAMAGVLDLRLAGPIAYDGIVQAKPWIGNGRADAAPADIDRALAVYQRACALLWVIAGGFAWAL